MVRRCMGLLLVCMCAGSLVADVRKGSDHAAKPFDWPQWQGPERTAISQETGLLKKWPKEGPKLVWKAEKLGGAIGGPSVWFAWMDDDLKSSLKPLLHHGIKHLQKNFESLTCNYI